MPKNNPWHKELASVFEQHNINPAEWTARHEECVRRALEHDFRRLLPEQLCTVMLRLCGITGTPQTLVSIGKELGLSSSRIGAIKKQALRRLSYPTRRLDTLQSVLRVLELSSAVPEDVVAYAVAQQQVRREDALEINALRRKINDMEDAVLVRTLHISEPIRWLTADVRELGLSTRVFGALDWMHDAPIYVCELCVRTDEELLGFHNFGKGSLAELKKALATHGLSLGMQLPVAPVS